MKKNLIKRILFIVGIAIVIMIAVSIMIKYDVEGEKELPFSISKILLVSTVSSEVNDDAENIWNIDVTQVNDVYMYINKTSEEDITIKEIKFENFALNKKPEIGNVKLLLPTGEIDHLYDQSTQNYLNTGFSYFGGKIDDLKDLEISNNGGILGFRFSLDDLGSFVSNENEEIIYDGRLLSNLGVTIEQIKFSVSFDIVITTSDNVNYKSKLYLDLPIESVIEEGSSNKEITKFDNLVFKRVNE